MNNNTLAFPTLSQFILDNTTSMNLTNSTSFPKMSMGSYSWPQCEVAASYENIGYSLLMGLILTGSFIGNIFVILAIFMSRQLRSRITIYFIVNLACSDLLLAVFTIPFKISSKLHTHQFCHDISACYLLIISDSIGNIASIFNLFFIALDRFIAISRPFEYAELLTRKRVKLIIIAIWLFSIAWSLSGIFQWGGNTPNDSILSIKKVYGCFNQNFNYYASSFCLYFIILFIVTCTYGSILSTALSHIKVIDREETSLTNSFRRTKEKSTTKTKSTKHRFVKKISRELKATKTVGIIYFAFLICWTPSAVINIILLVDSTYFYPMQMQNKSLFLFIYYFFIEILPIFNTMLNPLIYSFSNKHFRKAFHKVAKKMLGRSNSFNYRRRSTTFTSSLGSSFSSV